MQIKGGEEFSHIRLQLKSLRSAESVGSRLHLLDWSGFDWVAYSFNTLENDRHAFPGFACAKLECACLGC